MHVEFPEKLQFLFEPCRYKVLYGGRGGAKSWGVARALLIMGASKPLRVLCAREYQKSMADSVHKLLSDQIKELGLESVYTVQRDSIFSANGTSFTFHGLHHNIANIKSIEGTDIAWIEEAQTVSKSSWETLIPTIRKEHSEIWITFNPSLAEDETYKRFIVQPPVKARVVKVNWQDNPWFPTVLLDEANELKAKDPDAYLNIWEGHCKQTIDGAIYANEIRKAMQEGRITKVPYISGKPVFTAWDLGHADMTSIWFYQFAGPGQTHVIDYYQNCGQKMGHYLQVLQNRGYVYGTHYLPHDAANETIAADKTPAGQARAAGFQVIVLERSPIAAGINTARTVFDNCVFDEEKCADGLQCLRNYRYDVDPDTNQFSKMPLHDWASHGGDAFRYMAVSMREKQERKTLRPRQSVGGSWMGA